MKCKMKINKNISNESHRKFSGQKKRADDSQDCFHFQNCPFSHCSLTPQGVAILSRVTEIERSTILMRISAY